MEDLSVQKEDGNSWEMNQFTQGRLPNASGLSGAT